MFTSVTAAGIRTLLIFACLVYSSLLYAQPKLDVVIRGISGELAENVRLYLSIQQQSSQSLLTETRLRRLHAKARTEIETALTPFGYYRPSIQTSLQVTGEDRWTATYIIDPGPPIPVRTLDITIGGDANSDPDFQQLLSQLPLHIGDSFDHRRYVDIKTRLAQLASERGYFDARFIEHRVDIDLRGYHADIHLKFDSGRRYHYGNISLRQDILSDNLLDRYIPFTKGAPYNSNDLIKLQQVLNDSNYFQSVEVEPITPERETATVPIVLTLIPRKINRYQFGFGYGTDTGLRAQASWGVSRVNNEGHRFSTEAKVAETGYSLGARYIIPVLDPKTDQLIYSGALRHEVLDSTISTIRSLGVGLNHSRGAWREILAVNYQQEHYAVAGVPGDSTLLIPGINWHRAWGERIYTLDGLALDLGLKGASKAIVSDASFVQVHTSFKAIRKISSEGRFIGRLQLGTTATSEFDKLPTSVRFFTGGSQSVRGYAYQSLGPMDASGNVVGGESLLVGSVEYEHRLRDKWSAALFYDLGNAINSFSDPLYAGVGAGIRWQSPVGPMRFDFAKALSLPGEHWRLHINIGPDL